MFVSSQKQNIECKTVLPVHQSLQSSYAYSVTIRATQYI